MAVTFSLANRNVILGAIFLVASLASAVLFDATKLPDYESYKRIYNEASLDKDWEIFFVGLCYIFNRAGFDYDSFRHFLFVFETAVSFLFIYIFGLKNKGYSFGFFSAAVVFFVFLVFVLEFYQVRIRAGLAISLVLLGLALSLALNNNVVFAIFLAIAFNVHFGTVLVLLVALASTYISSRSIKSGSKAVSVLANLLGVSTVFAFVILGSESRGNELASPLNPFRFFVLAVVPLVLFMIVRPSGVALIDKSSMAIRYENFMLYASIMLSVMCAIGVLEGMGESLVRVYGVLSVLSFGYAIYLQKFSRGTVLMWFGICNALFFLNTINESIF